MKKQKPLVSVLIINYNNSKFIEECINSIKSQTYNKVEIIFFDDNSKDNSLEIIKKYKKIKIIKNKSQTKFGSLNQIIGFKKSLKLSKGEIILLLDSDDFFQKQKIEKIVNYFLKNKNRNIVFDYPIIKRNNYELPVKKKANFIKSYWGYIHPTSCISLRKKLLKNIFYKIEKNKFLNIWLDLRILIYAKYNNEYNVINNNLTYYRQHEGNVSSKFKKFNKFWWIRRNEAHEYFFQFTKKNNLKIRKNIDFYITKFINKFL